MLLKNFIVTLAAGVATPTDTGDSNPLYRKATQGSDYKIGSGNVGTIYSISGSKYNNTGKSSIYNIGNYQGIALGTGTTPPA